MFPPAAVLGMLLFPPYASSLTKPGIRPQASWLTWTSGPFLEPELVVWMSPGDAIPGPAPGWPALWVCQVHCIAMRLSSPRFGLFGFARRWVRAGPGEPVAVRRERAGFSMNGDEIAANEAGSWRTGAGRGEAGGGHGDRRPFHHDRPAVTETGSRFTMTRPSVMETGGCFIVTGPRSWRPAAGSP